METPTPLMDEPQALAYLKANFNPNPKKLRKLATRMIPMVNDNINRGLIQSIFNVADPVAYVRKAIQQMDEYPTIIKELVEDGKHGMIILENDVIYPLDLKTRPNWLKIDDKWNLEEEKEIQYKAMHLWMEAQGVKKFNGKVVLFEGFGFTGIPRQLQYPPYNPSNPWN